MFRDELNQLQAESFEVVDIAEATQEMASCTCVTAAGDNALAAEEAAPLS